MRKNQLLRVPITVIYFGTGIFISNLSLQKQNLPVLDNAFPADLLNAKQQQMLF